MATKNSDTCPIGEMAVLLSDTWTMLIIRDLLRKEKRFSDLERSLEGISSRTLTKKLKRLEEEGIITKNNLHYTITKAGKPLGAIIDAMSVCGKKLIKKK